MRIKTRSKKLRGHYLFFFAVALLVHIFFRTNHTLVALILTLYLYTIDILEFSIIEINILNFNILYFKFFILKRISINPASTEIKSERVVRFRGGIDFELFILNKTNREKYYTTKKLFEDGSQYEELLIKLSEAGFQVKKNY